MTAHTHTSEQFNAWIGAAADALPAARGGTLIGRVFEPTVAGPTPVLVEHGEVYALTPRFATVSAVTEHADPAAASREARGAHLGSFADRGH